jgi:putative drug exporter of the RND superfamily
MKGQRNIASVLGGWSARHRLAAIGGWLALVIVTMLIGSAVGQATMTQAEYGTGESGRAMRLLTDAGIKDPAQELVLVHADTGSGPASAVQAVISGVQGTGQVQDMRPPVTSANGRDVLIQFAIKGDPDTAASRLQPVLDAMAGTRAAHPGVTIDEFGTASANKWFNDTIVKDARRAEWTVVPLAIGILLVVFGALLAAVLPVLLDATVVRGVLLPSVMALLGDRNWYLPRRLSRLAIRGG